MSYVPAPSDEEVKLAEFPVREADPRTVVPLENVTVPVAVSPYTPVTSVVNVTD